jgi:chromosome segregation and condensation protein ScpB
MRRIAPVLVTIAYFQPVTRAELRTILGHAVGRKSSPACGMPA